MNIKDLQIVVKVAELGSITKAAEAFDMQVATASAALKRVEQSLGAELFVRSTRNLRVSAEGERFLPLCRESLNLLDTAERSVKGREEAVEGELRISVSSDLGRNVVLPWLNELMELHKGLSVRITISDTNIDFYRDEVDVVLRYGVPQNSNAYGFKICDVPKLLCGTESFIKDAQSLNTPNDLSAHEGLFYQLHGTLYNTWELVDTVSGQRYKVKMKGRRSANDGDLVRRWCVDGKGIALKSALDMSEDLLSGRVVRVMPRYLGTPTELWLMCPSRGSITPTLRVLRDFLREKTKAVYKDLSEII